MARNYVRKNSQGEEMYPKTSAEQVYYEGGILHKTQAAWNEQVDFDLSNFAYSSIETAPSDSGGITIIIHKGSYADIKAEIPLQEGSVDAGLIDNYDYEDFTDMRDVSIPNLELKIENIEKNVKSNQEEITNIKKGVGELTTAVSVQYSALEKRVAALENKMSV